MEGEAGVLESTEKGVKEQMTGLKITRAILTVFVTFPLWLYLMWYILTTVEAGELQMFLFWVYVPFTLLVGVISVLLTMDDK